ncbi:DUF512 domain-containing protein [Effusibacillus lacus]|uniref:Fe-S oxidoreductase n=1 Tax=Effusibacillus lacus TaxID=1348429 RepID=A0A292YKL1_9BACL|nr:DUF512 domain-containing protein [Effusibacillus lacus]TCS75268.1 putative radical SAM enzyme (TIGR03279 family) [Effusibacillus lacus]GAX89706.1 Fe-S oxidoreductase [Effusibacillus lacus]
MPKIQAVRPGSLAEELELEPGDEIKSINGQPIKDIIDYQFAITDEAIELEVIKSNGEEWLIDVEKGYDETLGVDWEHPTVDRIKLCHNKCVFCFVDQIPGNMRQTLNMRDDDYRLSFLHGNFVTLTNLKQADLERIARLKMSPLNISVHTTNPELRNFMVGHKKAGEILNQIAYLAEHEIEMNTQIVLCPGMNDGEELDRTIRELAPYWPQVRTLSVVPVGLTKHRRGLAEIRSVTPEEADRVISQVEAWQEKFLQEKGAAFVHAADEFYVMAGREVPPAERYDEFAQTENGVGLIRNFLDELEEIKEQIPSSLKERRHVAVVTGMSPADTIRRGIRLLENVGNLRVDLHVIRNDFYGHMVTVTGLITGFDIVAQLKDTCTADLVMIPDIMLKDDADIFLDDYTVDRLSAELGKPVLVLPANATGLIKGALGMTDKLPPRRRYEATLAHSGMLGCAGGF